MHNICSFSLHIPLRLLSRGIAILKLTNLMIPSEALATVVMMKVTKWILVVKLDFSDKK